MAEIASTEENSGLTTPDSDVVDTVDAKVTQEHSFLMDQTYVEEMEEGLLKLLNNFKEGKLTAFDENCSLDKMTQITILQEKLAQLHFDLESEESNKTALSEEERTRRGQEKMDKLLSQMECLCSSVQNLHQHPEND